MEALTKKTFEKKVLKAKKMVVVDFSGKKCQPCIKLKPIMEEIAKKYNDKDYIDFYELEMEENAELFNKFNVMTIPHLIFFNNGKVIDELLGLKSEEAIIDFLKQNIVALSSPDYFVE